MGSRGRDRQPEPLFERIGGETAVARLVGAFYERVLADEELRPFFADTSMEKLQRMQREFFAAALGGPIRYTGRPLAEVHYGRGIQPRHLRRFLDHLLETLRGQAMDQQDVYEIASRIQTYADEITGTTSVDG
jgi:hemoglobin